jgi:CBS domain-containing protein
MKVTEIMTRELATVSSGETLQQAGTKMRMRDVGILPVVEDGKIVGVLTDRDIVLRAVSNGMRPHMTTVREVMTRKAVCCYEDQTITEVAMLMEHSHVRRLFVLDRNENPVGVVSLDDLAVNSRTERISGRVLGKVASVA